MDEGHEHRRYSRVKWGDQATLTGDHGEATGSVLDISLNGVLVAAGSGAVRLGDVKPAGSSRMGAAAWVRGRGVDRGERFE